MPFIGNQPSNNFVSLKRQDVTGSGSASVTLDHSVSSINDILVYVNHVKQDPNDMSVSGTTLTLGGTISASDSCYIIYLGQGLQTVTPATGTITNAMVSDSAAIATSKLGAGAVAQVVSVNKTDKFTTTSTSYVDVTDLSLNITPSSTSSKVLVFINLQVFDSSAGNAVTWRLVNGSTEINVGTDTATYASTGGQLLYSTGTANGTDYVKNSDHFLHSPASTSQQTYKIQIRGSGNTVGVNKRGVDTYISFTSNISAMEILA